MKRLALSLATAMAVALIPAAGFAETKKPAKKPAAAASTEVMAGDVVTVAQQAGTFTTLLAAATSAGLVDALKTQGPITVFAPTDDAFKKLPAGAVDTLLRPENRDQLRQLIAYHVVQGKVTSQDVVGKTGTVATLDNGQTLAIDGRSGVKVNDANVIKADVMASNGVIHVIDTVLLPEGPGAAPPMDRSNLGSPQTPTPTPGPAGDRMPGTDPGAPKN